MKLNKYNTYLREELIWQLWEQEKNRIVMKDISEIFGISLGNVYRIIKKITEKNKRSNQKIKDKNHVEKLD